MQVSRYERDPRGLSPQTAFLYDKPFPPTLATLWPSYGHNYGLILGLELEPAAARPGARAYGSYLECFERGLLVRRIAGIIALSPSLIVERSHIDQMFGTLAEVLRTQR